MDPGSIPGGQVVFNRVILAQPLKQAWIMDQLQRLEVYRAQTKNVSALQSAWKQVNRQLNQAIARSDKAAAEINTKIMGLIYCAFAEAVFSKMIHTPHGFTIEEIGQISTAARGSVKSGWLKCTELAVNRISASKHNHRANVLQQLERLISDFVFDPSQIRNKLAHGQWQIALNRDNTSVNRVLTREIESNTFIDYYKRKAALARLANIIEDIIESPSKAHFKDYWAHVTALEAELLNIATWTIEKKVEQLLSKKSRGGRHPHQSSRKD